MDRAHRIGQKQTVNVYRLLMKDSLEERVLGLQRFKVDVANAVINEACLSCLFGSSLNLLFFHANFNAWSNAFRHRKVAAKSTKKQDLQGFLRTLSTASSKIAARPPQHANN